MAEQIQLVDIASINREKQLTLLSTLPDPPEDGEAFAVYGSYNWEGEATTIKTSAITYSQHWNLPTISGHSGLIPQYWHLSEPSKELTPLAALRWIKERKIKGKVYLFNEDTHQWRKSIDLTRPLDFASSGETNLLTTEIFYQIAESGWSSFEDWGIWNEGYSSIIGFPRIRGSSGSVKIVAQLTSFLHPKNQRQRLEIYLDDEQVLEHVFTPEKPETNIVIPVPEEKVYSGFQLRWVTPDAKSPASLGPHNDPRILGVGLRELKLIEIPPSGQ